MVTVEDPGNAAYKLSNGTTLGSVAYPYQLGMYEQTVQDWCDFLTAVASHPHHPDNKIYPDPHYLWNQRMTPSITRTSSSDGGFFYTVVEGKGLLPITHVNFYSILRCCNWHEHNAPILEDGVDTDAITEHGAYEFAADGTVTINPNAHFTIPSQDEWIKSAYYKGNGLNAGYWNYPTQSNNNPGNNNGDVTNQANYNSRSWLSSPLLRLSPVNFFNDTQSFYGCRDMGGNVNEWTSTSDAKGNYIVRGGSYESQYNYIGCNDLMIAATPQAYGPNIESDLIGFRVAYHDSRSNGVGSNENQEGTIQAYPSFQSGQQRSSRGSSGSSIIPIVAGIVVVIIFIVACWISITPGSPADLYLLYWCGITY